MENKPFTVELPEETYKRMRERYVLPPDLFANVDTKKLFRFKLTQDEEEKQPPEATKENDT